MKKLVNILLLVFLVGGTVLFSYSIQKEKISDSALNNIKLISIAIAEDTGTGNTGPKETVECGGIFNGKQKGVCMCTNAYNCTETACF